MCSGEGTRALPRVGFPIRKSPDQRSFSSSPRLIAAIHVLHRLLVPRHPPCALVLLLSRRISRENTNYRYAVLKERTGRMPAGERPRGASLSKLNSMAPRRQKPTRGSDRVVDVIPGEPRAGHHSRPPRRTRAILGQPAVVKCHRIPRKEVIQPQLPLRLPCYDFTPITDPAFDGSLPCGLGHRLRALPAFVV